MYHSVKPPSVDGSTHQSLTNRLEVQSMDGATQQSLTRGIKITYHILRLSDIYYIICEVLQLVLLKTFFEQITG